MTIALCRDEPTWMPGEERYLDKKAISGYPLVRLSQQVSQAEPLPLPFPSHLLNTEYPEAKPVSNTAKNVISPI
jgi:hypothetical protein